MKSRAGQRQRKTLSLNGVGLVSPLGTEIIISEIRIYCNIL
jgi:hypothetical protein